MRLGDDAKCGSDRGASHDARPRGGHEPVAAGRELSPVEPPREMKPVEPRDPGHAETPRPKRHKPRALLGPTVALARRITRRLLAMPDPPPAHRTLHPKHHRGRTVKPNRHRRTKPLPLPLLRGGGRRPAALSRKHARIRRQPRSRGKPKRRRIHRHTQHPGAQPTRRRPRPATRRRPRRARRRARRAPRRGTRATRRAARSRPRR